MYVAGLVIFIMMNHCSAIKIEGCGSDQHLVVEQAQRSFVLTCKEITAGYHVTWFFRKHHKTWSDFISAAVCYTYNVHCYRWLQTLTAHRINDSVIELRVQDVFHERPSLIQDSSITCREFDDNNNFMHDYTCNLHVIPFPSINCTAEMKPDKSSLSGHCHVTQIYFTERLYQCRWSWSQEHGDNRKMIGTSRVIQTHDSHTGTCSMDLPLPTADYYLYGVDLLPDHFYTKVTIQIT
ncbi:uncharacterized protein LOC112568548 [Pomacea canaliculata]|uniref:uncharacterized protein LOC112568548 n=1 Tax=Pomacea canaliculata TaxID=400727 RepID=UPI000D73766B|nr:uncharacterized protein LOC112568548 [Pomacea canaliculata]